MSTPGFRPPKWVRGRCGDRGPPGRRAGAGRRGAGRARGASFGGSFALDSALTETGEARVPERSVGAFGGSLSFSVFLGLAGETFSTRNARATLCFYPGGSLGGGGGSSAQLGRWRSVSYLGSPVRAGAGRRRATQIPVALMVSAPLGNSSNSSSETWSILPWLFGTGGGACALVDFSSRVFFSNEAGFRGKLLSRLSLIRDRGSGTCPGAGPALLPGSGPAAPERGASVGRTVSGIRSLHRRPLCRGPGQSRPRESSSEWPASEEVCRDKWVGTKMASASWPCNNSEPLSSQVE